MNISYLILAHSNFRMLDALIEELDGPGINFYVHIDKKSKEIYKNHKSNVVVLKKRFLCNWSRYGLVRATLELLENSFENSREKSDARFVLLSGADYPIRPDYFIAETFSQNVQYTNLRPACERHADNIMERFEYYHFDYDFRSRKLKSRILGFCERALKALHIKRRIPFELFVGSQWFAFTGDCCGIYSPGGEK